MENLAPETVNLIWFISLIIGLIVLISFFKLVSDVSKIRKYIVGESIGESISDKLHKEFTKNLKPEFRKDFIDTAPWKCPECGFNNPKNSNNCQGKDCNYISE